MDPFFLVALPVMLLIAMKLRALKAFDELMEIVHGQHHDDWEALGRPIGYFWRPQEPEATTIRGVLARRPLTWRWLLRDPPWLPEDSPARIKLATWRITTLASSGGFFLFAGLVLLKTLLAWGSEG